MSLLLVGISHRSAPLALLGQVAVSGAARPGLLTELLASPQVPEAMIVSTCNRVEVYTDADAGDVRTAVAGVQAVLARHSGIPAGELTDHLYVRRDEAAARHLFEVAAGLDSLVVGDEQIIGQVRSAYAASTGQGAAGRVLHEVAQQALRVGKQVRAQTGLGRVGASVVSLALRHVSTALGSTGLTGRRTVVFGAGAMGAVAVAHLQRCAVSEVLVANRTPSRAHTLAATTRSPTVRALTAGQLDAALTVADVLVVCTSSQGALLRLNRTVIAARPPAQAPLVICDLGLPHNVDPAIADLPGVVLVDLQTLQQQQSDAAGTADATGPAGSVEEAVAAAHRVIDAETSAYLTAHRAEQLAPAVTALRRHAAAIVHAELLHLESRMPALSEAERSDVGADQARVRPPAVPEAGGGERHRDELGREQEHGARRPEPPQCPTPQIPPNGRRGLNHRHTEAWQS